MAIKLDEARIRRLSTNGTTTIAGGHVYLTGSSAGSSTGNTTQLVFGTSSNNHVVLSSNDNALVINPTTSSTTNQIVLYLNQKSKFPSGIDAGSGGITTTGAISASGNISGNYIHGTWLYTSAATALTTASKIAVIHSDNYIYYITPANLTTLIKDNASGTWNISINGNAATATTASRLAVYNNFTYTTGVQYYQGQPKIGTTDGLAYEGSSSNYKLWSFPANGTAVDRTNNIANVQVMRFYWGSTYFTDLFISPNQADLWTRCVQNGTAKAWRKILDSDNYSSYALSKSGGTMNTGAQILRASSSKSWVDGRKGALLAHAYTSAYRFTNNQYNPLWSAKSINGSWDCGTYTANNNLYFTYITDTNFDAGTNTTTHQVIIGGNDGKITASGFIGPLSGNATSASNFNSARTIALTGAVTGSASSNGASGWSIAATIAEKQITPTDIATTFRTQTKGDANLGAYLSVIRSESTDSSGYMPQHGSGIAFGRQDTQTYLYTNYSSAQAYIGGGNGNKLNWVKRIAFTDGTAASGTWGISISGNAATASQVNGVIPEWSGSIAWADTSWIAAWSNDGAKIKALAKSSFAAAGHTHSYAGSSSAGGAAHSANKLNINNTAGLADCLQYIQTSSQTAGNDLPSAAWHHVIKMNHGNGDTYYKRLLAFDFWGQNNVYTTTAEGNGTVKAWKKFWIEGDSVTGAVWNDYAEYRESDCKEFGRVLAEKGDDTLTKTTKRLQPFAGVSSDTWGFCQGETEKAKTPIAVAGRVLVYTYRNRKEYKPGDAVCAAPNGTVDIMTREEIIKYPDRIVGTVSCVPEYETWGSGDRDPVKVGNRIWIKVR